MLYLLQHAGRKYNNITLRRYSRNDDDEKKGKRKNVTHDEYRMKL